MSLDKNDLKAIKSLLDEQKVTIIEEVKDIVDFAVEKSEMKIMGELGGQINEIKRNIDDLIETNDEFLGIFKDHESRISHLELQSEASAA